MRRALESLRLACREALCLPIRAYKKFISPGLGHNCRFVPSCSEYAMEAIRTHGCIKGLVLAVWRLARCQPFGKWGFDPVPERGRWKNPRRVVYPAKGFGKGE